MACALDLDPMTPALGSIVANRFQLVRELGRGAMGTVWLAEHQTLGVRCAVKFMNIEAMGGPAYADRYLARFELEARAIAQLGSTNVVRILDYDTHEGVPFIAMECLQGEDLAARLRRVGRLDATSTYAIVSQVANGLAKAHAAGIVHRDLKPENIFLAQDDDGEVAKLLDFGVAKLTGIAACDAGAGATEAGMLIGTPFYMSPEQIRNVDEIDHRADLWSLAVIAFECLTGRLPFQSVGLGDLFAKIIFEPLPVPSQIDPGCTAELDLWWGRAVARDARERFAGAREMADALGRALGVSGAPVALGVIGGPVKAATHGATRRASVRPAGARTRRFLAIALLVVIAPLVVTIGGGAIAARSERRATSMNGAVPARSTTADGASLTPPPVAHVEPVVAKESAPPSLRATQCRAVPVVLAAGSRADTARGALVQSRPPAPRPAADASASPPDDIDFGI